MKVGWKMKRNRKRKRINRTSIKIRHIAGRAYDAGHGGSKATSKWQRARITLHAGFTKITLPGRHNKTNSGFFDSSKGVGRKRRMSSTTDRYRAGILDGHRDLQIRWLRFLRHSLSQRVMDLTKKGGKWEQGM